MPRDGSGVYTLPTGTPAVTDTTIESTKYNGFIGDVETDLNTPRPIIAGGTGASNGTTARQNMQAERAEQQITNYDAHAYETGSFWSAAGATNAPNGTDGFTGQITRVADGAADKWTVVARSRQSGTAYIRQKVGGGAWSVWITEASDKVAKIGDSMSGDLIIAKNPYPQITLNVNTPPGAGLWGGQKNSLWRWQMMMPTPDAESTGNAGSNFTLRRYDDAGNFIDDPFTVVRASGNVGIGTVTPNITAQPSGSRVLTVNGPTQRSLLELASDQADAAGNTVGQIGFVANSNPAGAGTKQVAAILGQTVNGTAGNRGGALSFWTKPDNAPLASAAMVINQLGNTSIGPGTPGTYKLDVINSDVAFGGMRVIGGQTTTDIRWDSPRAGTSNFGWRLNGLTLGDMQLLQSTAPGGDPFAVGRNIMGIAINGATTFYQASTFNGIISSNSGINIYGGGFGINFSDPTISLTKAADANVVQQYVYAGANPKWMLRWADASSNNYALYRYNSGGSITDSPIKLTWSTGTVELGCNVTWPTTIQPTGILSARAFNCKAGSENGYGGNNFNIDSNGSTAQIWINGANLGTISVTCDYRIKKDVADLDSMWEKVRALRPISYTQAEYNPPPPVTPKIKAEPITMPDGNVVMPDNSPIVGPSPMVKADNIERWGFIAHEVQQTLLPTAATGMKDSKDHIQALNVAPIVAALTKALQEAMARIEALEAKLEARA